MITHNTIEQAYSESLIDVFFHGTQDAEQNVELFNYSFCISNINNILKTTGFIIDNETRNFDYTYASNYYTWLMTGSLSIDNVKLDTNIKIFSGLDTDYPTAYGPRIMEQLPGIIDELLYNPNSRRAVIKIGYQKDNKLLKLKREGLTDTEFPCTNTITFFIRNNQLHCHVQMRSNNMTTTFCYDLYNFINLQYHVTYLLNQYIEPQNRLTAGNYYHNITNAHIKSSEIVFAQNIIAEYQTKNK